jgi:adenylylsulfate kinase-like enzyme
MIYWLTGQPGSGKTTIAKALINRFGIDGSVFHIDGDDIRGLFENKDYSENGRRKNVELAQQIAQYLNDKGFNVVVSLVSPYKDQRDRFKEKMAKDFVEVFVHTSEIRGREDFFVKDYQSPDYDYLEVDTTNIEIHNCVELIMNYVKNKKV